MPDYMSARVLEISEIRAGSEALGDHPLGVTTLTVYDASDFSDTGGQLEIEGIIYGYSDVDQDEGIITLTSALSADVPEDTEIWLYPASYEKEAMCQIDEEDSVMARVPHHLEGSLDSLVRDGYDEEAVTVYLDGSEWVIHEVFSEQYRLLPENVTGLPNLINVVIPNLQEDLDYLNETTLPELNLELQELGYDMEDALGDIVDLHSDLATLNNITIPGLNSRLGNAENDIESISLDLSDLEVDLSSLGSSVSSLQELFPITSTSISDGAVTTPKMTANSINGDRILANSLNASKITALSIGADRLAANSVTTQKLSVASRSANLLANGSFLDMDSGFPAGWSLVTGDAYRDINSAAPGGVNMVLRTVPGVSTRVNSTVTIPATAGTSYAVSCWMTSEGDSEARIRMVWRDSANSYFGFVDVINETVPDGEKSRYTGQATAPEGTSWLVIELYNVATPDTFLLISDLKVQSTTFSALIEDGAITTPKLIANAVTAGKLAAKSVTAEKLTIGALGDELLSNGNFYDPDATGAMPAKWTAYAPAGTNVYRELNSYAPGGAWLGIYVEAGNSAAAQSDLFPVTAGDTISVTGKFMYWGGLPQSVIVQLSWRDAAGTYLSHTDVWWQTVTAWLSDDISTAQRMEGVGTAPAGAKFARVEIYNHDPLGGCVLFCMDFSARKSIVSAQIGDGAIKTNHMVANTISGDRITFNTLNGDKVTVNTLSADRIISNTFIGKEITGAVINGGTVITGGTSGPTIVQSVQSNPFIDGAPNWALSAYNLGVGGWNRGQVWGVHVANDTVMNSYFGTSGLSSGHLKISSPYVGSASNLNASASLDLFGMSNGKTWATLDADVIALEADTMRAKSSAGTFDFQLWETNRFSFRNQSGSMRLNMEFDTTGVNRLAAKDGSSGRARMDLWANQIFFDVAGTSIVPHFYGTPSSSRPAIGHFGNNVALVWGAASIKVAGYNDDGAFRPIQASAFNVNSNEAQKFNAEPITGALDVIDQVEVYDYELPVEHGGTHRRASMGATGLEGPRPRNYRHPKHRGLMAQELQRVLPDAVFVNDVDHPDSPTYGVDMYALLSTAIAAIKELKGQVDELKTSLSS